MTSSYGQAASTVCQEGVQPSRVSSDNLLHRAAPVLLKSTLLEPTASIKGFYATGGNHLITLFICTDFLKSKLVFNGYRRSFPGVLPGRDADHSPPSSAEVKNEWSYTTMPYIRHHGVDKIYIYSIAE